MHMESFAVCNGLFTLNENRWNIGWGCVCPMGQAAVLSNGNSYICFCSYDHCGASQKRIFADNKLFSEGKNKNSIVRIKFLYEFRQKPEWLSRYGV